MEETNKYIRYISFPNDNQSVLFSAKKKITDSCWCNSCFHRRRHNLGFVDENIRCLERVSQFVFDENFWCF